MSDTSDTLYVCSKHYGWFCHPEPGARKGYRIGYLAAACAIDEYRSGRVMKATLSQTELFENQCPHCHALHFKLEAVSIRGHGASRLACSRCCRNGALATLPLLPPAPPLLAALLTCTTPATPDPSTGLLPTASTWKRWSQSFQTDIRAYNCSLGFASYSDCTMSSQKEAALEDSNPCSRGPPVYILHGRAYHVVGTLYPQRGSAPKFAQLYIYDPAVATAKRKAAFPALDECMLRALLDMLTEIIPPTCSSEPAQTAPMPRSPFPGAFSSHARCR